MQNPVDWNGDKFSDYAKINRWQITPDLYWWVSDKFRLNAGLTYTNEDREGGAMPALQKKNDTLYSYIEKNKSEAFSSKFRADVLLENTTISIINGINRYSRNLSIPNYVFRGIQLATFTEITGETRLQKHVIQSVSYTHLDVYKRQVHDLPIAMVLPFSKVQEKAHIPLIYPILYGLVGH